MTNEPKYLTTETDAGFRAVIYAVEQGEGYIELFSPARNGWRRPFAEITLDGIVNKMKHGFHYRIPNPAYKEPVQVPAGWRQIEKDEVMYRGDYVLNNGTKWVQTPFVPNELCNVAAIRQVIDIDLSKQPSELKAWSKNNYGEWYGTSAIPEYINGRWAKDHHWYLRKLFLSEYPKTWRGKSEDSLLVRPEAVGGA